MGKNLVIYYNDSIDSDNLAAAMALFKAAFYKPNTRILWILEPRQVCFGLSMTPEQVSQCKNLIQQHFASLGDPFKVLLGGLINQQDLDNVKGLTGPDRKLLQTAVKPEFGSKEDAMLHGRLAAWDFATCVSQWSNNASNEIYVDFDSLEEINNPVNPHFHHHEELINRSKDELEAYDHILAQPSTQRTRSIPAWYKKCIDRLEREESISNTSIQPFDLDVVCHKIKTAPNVDFFGGSSLRILRQFLEKGVAGKMRCHLQVGSCDMSANLFANQFNIALNREAAKTVLDRSTEFLQFTVVPSHTAQSIRYSALGLKHIGGHCLEKRILAFNCREDPVNIVTNRVSLEDKYPEQQYAMPDLTAFLCALLPEFLGSKRGHIKVDSKGPNSAILFNKSDEGIQMFDKNSTQTLSKSGVIDIFERLAGGKVLLD
ncbi:hypothetical protein FHETE_7249 [Fusarium heterosporum]|uniref:Uncharacterized protein n=1 Tax=Fusarium heterosporum TaxID=42747 RepID=A0A8H5WMF7_FUSHE|nr:hypothetical protein FHETE_7249 [Fusarium heterosporum]